MAFKMNNPFKQSVAESTGTSKPITPVIKEPKKCYMTNPDTGEKTEIPCDAPVKGVRSSGGTVRSTNDANLRKMKKYTRGSKFIGIHG